MKKSNVFIFIIVLILGVIVLKWNFDRHYQIDENINMSNKIYLQEIILEQVMYDYNYLTGNSEETTTKYFESLKNGEEYSLEKIKSLNLNQGSSFEIVMKIQNEYDELIKTLTVKEKEDLDKYLLEQTLKFYYENATANV